MIINTSEYRYLFQKLEPTAIVAENATGRKYLLETFLRHKHDGAFLRSEVFPFPDDDTDLAQETISSGNFINPFIYADNKTRILKESEPLTVLDYNPKNNYLVVNDRSEIINP